jgi:hypothetical protein
MPAQAIHVAIWTMRECSPQGAHGVQCAESGAADRRVEWNSELWGWSCWDGTESHARNPGTAKGQPMGDALSGIWRIPPLACKLQPALLCCCQPLLPTAASAQPAHPSPAQHPLPTRPDRERQPVRRIRHKGCQPQTPQPPPPPPTTSPSSCPRVLFQPPPRASPQCPSLPHASIVRPQQYKFGIQTKTYKDRSRRSHTPPSARPRSSTTAQP